MKRLVFLLLIACGDKREAPAPTAPLPPPARAVLSEAQQALAAGKRDPTAWVALAHAQAAAKLPEAKTTLELALAAARADTTAKGAQALVLAVEVAVALGDPGGAAKLLDEAAARIAKEADREALLRLLLSPVVDLRHEPTIGRLQALAEAQQTPFLVLVERARAARRSGTANAALLDDAAKLAQDPAAQVVLAFEAVHSKAPALAKQLVEGLPELAHTQEAAERATTFAVLAAIHAFAGEQGSVAFEIKALQAAEKDSEDIDDDEIWVYLAMARAKRGDTDGAIELVARLASKVRARTIAYELVESGELEAATKILGAIEGEPRFLATAHVVEVLATTNLDAAKQLATAGPMWKMKLPGIEHVLRAYALRGDLPAVRALGEHTPQPTGPFVDLAARTLARQGKCADAVAAAKGVTQGRGECLAVIARYCPDSTL